MVTPAPNHGVITHWRRVGPYTNTTIRYDLHVSTHNLTTTSVLDGYDRMSRVTSE